MRKACVQTMATSSRKVALTQEPLGGFSRILLPTAAPMLNMGVL